MTLKEDFMCPNCLTRGPHTHACQEPVKIQKMDLEKIKELKFYCGNCGRVADVESKLCQPKPLKPEGMALFVKAARGEGVAEVCAVCGQPVSPPGHVCDPKGLPYVCEFCGEKVTKPTHMCKKILEKAQWSCLDCGRVAVKKERLCAPKKLK